ncbi:MAG TPA: DUF4097 family beta strand repeat-containing protein [Mobilitalea sp.]|nr:DUF4097 family beta strand repeat-containing protein [Mobilitalea sp.]
MSSFQKTIKYIAIAFAVFLAVVIISVIANAAFAVVSAVSGGIEYSTKNEKMVDFTENFTDVKSLNIENATGKLIIKTGDSIKVEAENVTEDFVAKVNSNGTLTISDSQNKGHFLWFNINGFQDPNSVVTLYLPSDFVAKDTNINSGAGSVTVEGLHSGYLMISAGAGNISGDGVSAEKVKIDGGVGSVTLQNVNFSDADFNCGVGSLDIQGVLLGNNKIDCGVGGVDLDLTGNVDDYDLDINSGIGTIRLNGDKISDEYMSNKDAANSIKIDGGVGDVKIQIGN